MNIVLDTTDNAGNEAETKITFNSYITELMRLSDVDASEIAAETSLSRKLVNEVFAAQVLPTAEDQAEMIEYMMEQIDDK